MMEGENAAFCVETREPVEEPSWVRNGQELVETPQILIRSFGTTHLLVLVQVTRHDAGVITFNAGESQTSAQLRVKCEWKQEKELWAPEPIIFGLMCNLVPKPDSHLGKKLLFSAPPFGVDWNRCSIEARSLISQCRKP